MANFNFNKVILGGRLTADPELKQTSNGVAVATFSIAVNRRFQSGGQQQTDFFNIKAWRGTAELISKHFRKGSSICVSGPIQNQSWADEAGKKHYTTEIIAEEVHFVDSKSVSASDPDSAPNTPDFEEIHEDSDLPF